MTAPARTRGRAQSTVERRRGETVLERRRAARLAATVTAPAKAPTKPPSESPTELPRTTPTRQPAGRTRSAAARRAYARRAHREGRPVEYAARGAEHAEDRAAGRASFVILIIVLLTVGVVTTLWLSTQAIADSYRLEHAKQGAEQLAERADQLQRDVTKAESASALAERARAMGMVPAGDPARLVVKPNGRVVVVGEPTKAEKPQKPKKPKPQNTSTHANTPPTSGQHPANAHQHRPAHAQGAG
jgi:hypothetical protein